MKPFVVHWCINRVLAKFIDQSCSCMKIKSSSNWESPSNKAFNIYVYIYPSKLSISMRLHEILNICGLFILCLCACVRVLFFCSLSMQARAVMWSIYFFFLLLPLSFLGEGIHSILSSCIIFIEFCRQINHGKVVRQGQQFNFSYLWCVLPLFTLLISDSFSSPLFLSFPLSLSLCVLFILSLYRYARHHTLSVL